jgi:DNA-binding transcriptional ArsR family regulator
MSTPEKSPQLSWDHGTAFDFFASLVVLYEPDNYGLRPSWAAGIRSRLSPSTREFFASVTKDFFVPLEWLVAMPEPKTARAVLDALEAMPVEDVVLRLTINEGEPEKILALLLDIRRRGEWGPSDRDAMVSLMTHAGGKESRKELAVIESWLGWWAHAEEFGGAFRAGMREYYEVFFREEERRIQPALERALAGARDLAARLPPDRLLEELSQGIDSDEFLTRRSLVLVPCYWCTPRIIYTICGDECGPGRAVDRIIMLFGARPAEDSLIPGDAIPARLLLALEALSDPTRLSILRAIISEPLTQAEIARKLRLRPPTISHHLKTLRIAGLITHISAQKTETRYGARLQQLGLTTDGLKDFLGVGNGGAPSAADAAADGAVPRR